MLLFLLGEFFSCQNSRSPPSPDIKTLNQKLHGKKTTSFVLSSLCIKHRLAFFKRQEINRCKMGSDKSSCCCCCWVWPGARAGGRAGLGPLRRGYDLQVKWMRGRCIEGAGGEGWGLGGWWWWFESASMVIVWGEVVITD